jgi:hypothetical protein
MSEHAVEIFLATSAVYFGLAAAPAATLHDRIRARDGQPSHSSFGLCHSDPRRCRERRAAAPISR